MKKFWRKYRFILIVLAVTFIFRLPSLFEPYSYGDEGIYLTLGLGIKRGLLLYRDIFDNKPPMIYLLAAAANATMFWFRFFLTASVLGSIFLFYELSKKLFNHPRASQITTLVFAFLTTIRFWEGNVANSEIFILLPTLLGFNLIFGLLEKEDHQKGKSYNLKAFLGIGAILSLGFLFKVPALFDFSVIVFFLLFLKEPKKFFSLGKKELALILGYSLPILLTGLYFWTRGAFGLFFRSCFVQTFGYLSSWGKTSSETSALVSLLKSDMAYRAALATATTFIIWLKRKSLERSVAFTALWFVFALFAANLSGRPYPHYLIQVIPPLALATGFVFNRKRQLSLVVFLGMAGLLVLALWRYQFWGYPTLNYYQNFAQFVLGRKSKERYLNFFNSRMTKIYELAEFVGANTKPQERLFIWGNEPYIYPLSKRLPVASYTVAYHIMDFKAYKQMGQILEKEKPAIIVVDQNLPMFQELGLILRKDYLMVRDFDGLEVFKRRIGR